MFSPSKGTLSSHSKLTAAPNPNFSFGVRIKQMPSHQIQPTLQFYQRIMSSIQEKQLFGVDVSDYRVARITPKLLEDKSSSLYNQFRLHFLAYALQFQTKLPNIHSIKRAEKRALLRKRKAILDKDSAIHSVSSKCPEEIVLKSTRKMCIEAYLKSIPKQDSANECLMVQGFSSIPSITPMNRPFRHSVRNFRIRVPRTQIPMIPLKLEKAVSKPTYFIKKKASQKRRRAQKHRLICQNKNQLLGIYGRIIFQSQWRIGLKQLKKSLNLPQDAPYAFISGMKSLFEKKQSPKKIEYTKYFIPNMGLYLETGVAPNMALDPNTGLLYLSSFPFILPMYPFGRQVRNVKQRCLVSNTFCFPMKFSEITFDYDPAQVIIDTCPIQKKFTVILQTGCELLSRFILLPYGNNLCTESLWAVYEREFPFSSYTYVRNLMIDASFQGNNQPVNRNEFAEKLQSSSTECQQECQQCPDEHVLESNTAARELI